jgi:hypothetical protein
LPAGSGGTRPATWACHDQLVNVPRPGRPGSVLLAAVAIGALLTPAPAHADGPGYGGDADSLTVRWQPQSGATGEGLAVYAVGFRGGSSVNLRVGAATDRAVKADASGALRILVVQAAAGIAAKTSELPVLEAAAGRLSAGTSVLAVGETPAGDRRTLVGAVPPPAAGTGPADVVPWAGSLALAGGAVLWFRRRSPGSALLSRYRHPARHRA